MQNPFKKRATEFIEDSASFIALTSPAPLKLFFEGDSTVLFDRLVTVIGTPGSGKTTLARLMDIDTIFKLLDLNTENAKNLKTALVHYNIIKDSKPAFISYRLPSSSNLRDIWELPYSEHLRTNLLRSFIQAKALLGWLRRLEKAEINIADIQVKVKEGCEAQGSLLKVLDTIDFRQRARSVEEEILSVITTLLPPREEELSATVLNLRFDAFEVIESFSILDATEPTDSRLLLKPLLIIDDGHELHPNQFADLSLWLKNRDMKIARWLMTRVDAISHEDFRKALVEAENNKTTPGTTLGRDHIFKVIQCEKKDRATFLSIANDIAKQYIQQMPSFNRKGISTLSQCLSDEPIAINETDLNNIEISVNRLLTETRMPEHQIRKIKDSIPSKISRDQFFAIYRILLNREKKRSPQADIFGYTGESIADHTLVEPPEVEASDEIESSKTKINLIIVAELQLLHEYGKPFYFSFKRLADASSSNIEQFINLADSLVDALETKILRGKAVWLDAREQHQFITERAAKTINAWDFPYSDSTKKLIGFIADRCKVRTLEANASLHYGANAFGIPQTEMDKLQSESPLLATLLHFALAYNALFLKENYQCKNKTWCLFVLGGLPCVYYGLTLNQGGFCEGHLADLVRAISQ